MTGFPTPLNATEQPQPNQVEDINDLIMQWCAADQQLKEIKKRESELRARINQSQMFDQSAIKGTQSYELGRGYQLKLNRKETVSVSNEGNAAYNAIIQLRNLGGLAAERADTIFKFNCRLSESTYKAMTDEEKAIIDPLVTRKPGSFSVELKEPKLKKE